jgi:hypothetical protein
LSNSIGDLQRTSKPAFAWQSSPSLERFRRSTTAHGKTSPNSTALAFLPMKPSSSKPRFAVPLSSGAASTSERDLYPKDGTPLSPKKWVWVLSLGSLPVTAIIWTDLDSPQAAEGQKHPPKHRQASKARQILLHTAICSSALAVVRANKKVRINFDSFGGNGVIHVRLMFQGLLKVRMLQAQVSL